MIGENIFADRSFNLFNRVCCFNSEKAQCKKQRNRKFAKNRRKEKEYKRQIKFLFGIFAVSNFLEIVGR